MRNAREICNDMSADLPIIKSQSENDFICSLMENQGIEYVWLGMKRNQSGFFWFDGSPAEPSQGAMYSTWMDNELGQGTWTSKKCAFLEFNSQKWKVHQCKFREYVYVLCQKGGAWSGWAFNLWRRVLFFFFKFEHVLTLLHLLYESVKASHSANLPICSHRHFSPSSKVLPSIYKSQLVIVRRQSFLPVQRRQHFW